MRPHDIFRVLVVDDDPEIAAKIKLAFIENGTNVRLNVTRSAEEAIAYLEAPWADEEFGANGLPNVILLDMEMPGMGGEGFLEWYYPQSRVRDVPVVAYSGSPDDALAKACFGFGVAGFLEKPEDFRELIPATRRALTHALDVKRQKRA